MAVELATRLNVEPTVPAMEDQEEPARALMATPAQRATFLPALPLLLLLPTRPPQTQCPAQVPLAEMQMPLLLEPLLASLAALWLSRSS